MIAERMRAPCDFKMYIPVCFDVQTMKNLFIGSQGAGLSCVSKRSSLYDLMRALVRNME